MDATVFPVCKGPNPRNESGKSPCALPLRGRPSQVPSGPKGVASSQTVVPRRFGQPHRTPVDAAATFLEEKADRTLIPTGPVGYVGYIALMGLVLTADAVGVIRNRRGGLRLIAGFLLLYAGLFVNFLTISRKVSHLAVCSVLFLLLLWLDRRNGPRSIRS